MVPNVFVSSTIADLHHLRDGIRETVLELGYNPVLSEYGDIGYLPTESAINSCYLALRDCQLAILIVGKRYGSMDSNGLSVTHNEFRTARASRIPLVALVDREVLSFSLVHGANPGGTTVFPGMDSADKTCGLLTEIRDASTNNGILPFMTVAEARAHLRAQFAHIVGDLLRRQFDPAKTQLADVLSEIRTLRHELRGGPPAAETTRYLRAMRFLVDDGHRAHLLRDLVEALTDNIEQAVALMLTCKTFDEFASATGVEVLISSSFDFAAARESKELIFSSEWIIDLNSIEPGPRTGNLMLVRGKRLHVDEAGHRYLSDKFDELLRFASPEAS